MPTTTPVEITPAIRGFTAGFAAAEPVYVPVADTMTPLECFGNCKTTVAQSGGKVVLGWAIWEREGAFIEAEHHAVVERDDGTMVDVTPHDGESHILFVADPNASYNGKIARNNHRITIADDTKVTEYVALANQINDDRRKVQMYGIEKLSANRRKEGMAATARLMQLQSYIDATYPGTPVYKRV